MRLRPAESVLAYTETLCPQIGLFKPRPTSPLIVLPRVSLSVCFSIFNNENGI